MTPYRMVDVRHTSKRWSTPALALGLVWAVHAFTTASITPAYAASEEVGKGEAVSPHIALNGLTVSVFRNARVRGMLSVDVTLELNDPSKREDIEKIMPRLRDQYIMALTRLASNRIDIDRPLDLSMITQTLQTATNKTIGAQTARVLIGNASVRRL